LSSETSAFKLQTPGKFPKEHRLHSSVRLFVCLHNNQVESLSSIFEDTSILSYRAVRCGCLTNNLRFRAAVIWLCQCASKGIREMRQTLTAPLQHKK